MIQGLLLAAGHGRRFGGDKLLHPLGGGQPLVVYAAQSLLAAVPVLAVIRPGQAELEAVLMEAGCRICRCGEADAGMGHSLAAGVRASAAADGWLVALGDMPFIRTGTHAAVVSALRGGAILAAPFHGGRRGHPVGFGKEFGAALRNLDGDVGARDLLHGAGARLHRIDVADGGVLVDIDRPADLAARCPGL